MTTTTANPTATSKEIPVSDQPTITTLDADATIQEIALATAYNLDADGIIVPQFPESGYQLQIRIDTHSLELCVGKTQADGSWDPSARTGSNVHVYRPDFRYDGVEPAHCGWSSSSSNSEPMDLPATLEMLRVAQELLPRLDEAEQSRIDQQRAEYEARRDEALRRTAAERELASEIHAAASRDIHGTGRVRVVLDDGEEITGVLGERGASAGASTITVGSHRVPAKDIVRVLGQTTTSEFSPYRSIRWSRS